MQLSITISIRQRIGEPADEADDLSSTDVAIFKTPKQMTERIATTALQAAAQSASSTAKATTCKQDRYGTIAQAAPADAGHADTKPGASVPLSTRRGVTLRPDYNRYRLYA